MKPYVICINTDEAGERFAFALDRSYRFVKASEYDLDECKIGDLVQSMIGVPATFSKIPEWAEKHPERCITLWFNYYD